MSSYSALERSIARFLSRFPGIKSLIKKSYSRVVYFRNKKQYKYKSVAPIKLFSKDSCASFFGYYDKSPINLSNEFVIFQSTEIETTTLPNPNVPVDLVLYNVKLDNYDVIDNVFSYNWQQGCKLMWLSNERFIYNNYDEKNNVYISKIYDINKKITKVINAPIYDCFGDKFALTLNFERLNIGRGDYAYYNKKESIDWSDNESDGLFYVDLGQNVTKLLVSIQQAISINNLSTMKDARHKFNHIMISPNGDKAMFMHRWFTRDNRRYDALLTCNVDGSELKVVANDEMVSHCYWYDNTHIFAYLRDSDNGDKYYLVNIDSTEKKEVGKGIIDQFGDGHPSVHGNKILFDTYPDKSRMKHLFIYDADTSNLNELGEFYESFNYYAETRCDLHPRFSLDGKKVFFDSVHEGKRHLYMVDLH